MIPVQTLPSSGVEIAFRHTPGKGPLIVFLPGYLSDMTGSKATALFAWAEARGRACLLLDYSGCGESGGDFAAGTLTRWCGEVLAVIAAIHPAGRVVLVGSSMGGWLMLLVAQALGARVAGLVGIAAAPDFTDWGYDRAQQADLAAGRIVLEENRYGPEPTPTHPAFWADGQAQRVLAGPIVIDAPVRLIHGCDDADVPVEITHRLMAALTISGQPPPGRSADVQATLVKGGDHRLSRPTDIALILATVAALVAPAVAPAPAPSSPGAVPAPA